MTTTTEARAMLAAAADAGLFGVERPVPCWEDEILRDPERYIRRLRAARDMLANGQGLALARMVRDAARSIASAEKDDD
jgi:hypothetical protein